MKIQYVFRKLEKSDFVTRFAQEHIEKVMNHFPLDPTLQATVKLEMENSPQHSGKDVYVCEIRVSARKHKNLIIKKRTANMYEAIALASDRLSGVLNRLKGRFNRQRHMRMRFNESLVAAAAAQ